MVLAKGEKELVLVAGGLLEDMSILLGGDGRILMLAYVFFLRARLGQRTPYIEETHFLPAKVGEVPSLCGGKRSHCYSGVLFTIPTRNSAVICNEQARLVL
ncbi:hypothetical protein A374_06691 [Fictibacillus macauensis ZFHKF-1]|uniref:Uncharacterized protein n=1 Tax=Fictibacillus macauensis ZFHKF-1 TaxID=1196324 RepID=I8J3C1_9BACL|nr:hypothetical protein [Fictibacillus macauensis]EIT86266.1 hypothetical protein A374_06691 [Fictibacillus macauensis ZFHKF-1]